MSANSEPTAPAPTMASVFGARSRKSASSEVITDVLLTPRPTAGIPLVREPVASTIAFFAVMHVVADLDGRRRRQHAGAA